jgi:hypothetical protein
MGPFDAFLDNRSRKHAAVIEPPSRDALFFMSATGDP